MFPRKSAFHCDSSHTLFKTITYTFCAVILYSIFSGPLFASWVWGLSPDIPAYDVKWKEFERQWHCRWDGHNIDSLINIAEAIEQQYPDRIESKLWLGRTYFIKAQLLKKNNCELYKKVEKLAIEAHRIDENSIPAFKLLISVLPQIGDIDYAMKHYGDWIQRAAPLDSGYVVPSLTGNAEWEKAITLWNSRAGKDFDGITPEGLEAIELFNAIADKNPHCIEALSWACRANYDVGQFYSSIDHHEEKGFPYYKKSIHYGDKALAINEYYVPANYWRLVSKARLIQNASLLKKAKNVPEIMEKGLLGFRENGLYNYYGPSLALATIITNGGWVAEKGLQLAGIKMEVLINQLELAQVVYPNKLYALYGLADIYAYQGEKEKALKVLDLLFSKNPDADPFIKLENRSVVRFARALKQEIEKNDGECHVNREVL